jgi:triosephosphate isomerase
MGFNWNASKQRDSNRALHSATDQEFETKPAAIIPPTLNLVNVEEIID